MIKFAVRYAYTYIYINILVSDNRTLSELHWVADIPASRSGLADFFFSTGSKYGAKTAEVKSVQKEWKTENRNAMWHIAEIVAHGHRETENKRERERERGGGRKSNVVCTTLTKQ